MSKSSDSLLVLNTGFTLGVDGPGQRMVIYLKGCNMRCPWCAAPESMISSPEVLFYPGRIEDSARLPMACPHGAVQSVGANPSRNTAVCGRCGAFECVSSDNPAFERAGEEMTIASLVDRALRYRSFYCEMGGVTVGGGEPTCQFDGLKTLLTELHDKRIHTAIETNGTSAELPGIFPIVDLMYIDLKHPDNNTALAITGQGNEVVLDNIKKRHMQGGNMIVRICLVPGYNADDDSLRGFGEALSAIGPLEVEIIPFHRRGEAKWKALGGEMPVEALEPTADLVQQGLLILTGFGLKVRS